MTDVIVVDASRSGWPELARAAECLRRGGLVAFPTETVYGLGVHALDAEAVRRLFAAKGRPSSDPLIVHVASIAKVGPLVATVPETARRLAERFWPGPLTLVLKKSAAVPDEVTAGLDTVAVRVPSHPVARALIEAAGVPVAAPSANLFSRPSPTRAAHVLEDLRGRIDMVVDGGPTTVGVESTVLDLAGEAPVVLRPGAVTLDMLRDLMPQVRAAEPARNESGAMRSPGLLTKHYSPRAPLTLYEGGHEAVERLAADAAAALARGERVGLLLATEDVPSVRRTLDASTSTAGAKGLSIVEAGSEAHLDDVAARLYAALRELDAAGPDLILARAFPAAGGLGTAIQDRLRRAAAGRFVITR